MSANPVYVCLGSDALTSWFPLFYYMSTFFFCTMTFYLGRISSRVNQLNRKMSELKAEFRILDGSMSDMERDVAILADRGFVNDSGSHEESEEDEEDNDLGSGEEEEEVLFDSSNLSDEEDHPSPSQPSSERQMTLSDIPEEPFVQGEVCDSPTGIAQNLGPMGFDRQNDWGGVETGTTVDEPLTEGQVDL